jgi:hypothetical protein
VTCAFSLIGFCYTLQTRYNSYLLALTALLALAATNIPTLRSPALLPNMGGVDEFNDRNIQIEAENEPYHQYEYRLENNASWAGALPVKQ